MAKLSKKSTDLKNYNAEVGEAYHVSKNGVLNVDLHDKNFRNEFIVQLRKIKDKREKILNKSKVAEGETA
ncbi:MAG: hypothetical protein ACI9SD_001752 [Pseudohongiellaceae bacterium]|jgi:hypothetical protein